MAIALHIFFNIIFILNLPPYNPYHSTGLRQDESFRFLLVINQMSVY